MEPIEKRLRRAEASVYLREKFNISRTPGTLAKLAVNGGGPKFLYDSRYPLYPVSEIDKWALSILTPLVGSTSENRGNHAKILEISNPGRQPLKLPEML